MGNVRRAFAMATLEQYLGLLINFITIAALSRLLTPAEIGLGVIATSLTMIVFSLREFVTTEFLIQRPSIRPADLRTSFTIYLGATILIGLGLCAVSPILEDFYGERHLVLLLLLGVMGAIIEAAASPTIALLRRELAFGTIARVRSIGSAGTAVVSIALAWWGFGVVSLAAGALVGSSLSSAIAIASRPSGHMRRPELSAWREVLEFGKYKGATTAVDRVYEALPQLLLGRILPISSVGLYNRANAVCGIPDRLLLSSIFSIAFPVLSAGLREAQDIKGSYLRALSYITVVYWPALLLLALLAVPVVHIVLGPNWAAIAPLVQIMSAASVFWFPAILTYPVLAALGANRDAFASNAIGRCAAALLLCSTSPFGLTAMALSQLVNLPLQMCVALGYVRRHVHFGWNELFRELAPSLGVTLLTLTGPVAILVLRGFDFDIPVGVACVAAAFAAIAWLAGVMLLNHPLRKEISRLRAMRRPAFWPGPASEASR